MPHLPVRFAFLTPETVIEVIIMAACTAQMRNVIYNTTTIYQSESEKQQKSSEIVAKCISSHLVIIKGLQEENKIDPMSYLLYCYAHAKLTSVSLNHRLSLGPFRSHRTRYLKIGGNKLHQTIQNAI